MLLPGGLLSVALVAFAAATPGYRSNPNPVGLTTATINTNGVFPWTTMTAESAPTRSECGHGAMIAWNDLLYVVTYLSVPNAGAGTGEPRNHNDDSDGRVTPVSY